MLFLLSVVLFLAMELIPLDPLQYLVDLETSTGPNENIEQLRESLGLNDPVPIKYVKWLGRTLRGDWGYSVISGASVSRMIINRLPATLELSAAALIISTILGLTAGFISAIKQNTPIDYLNTATGLIAISVPDFFFGISIILIFGVKLQWLPTGNRFSYGANTLLDRFSHILMPALVLGLVYTAALMRTTRASMLDVLNADYIKTARSKGLSKTNVYIKHALRNALIPIMLLLCFRLPMLIGGAVIVETVFNWTGMGQLILMGVGSKDYPIVMATVLATATVLLLASMLVDILTAVLDPRVRIER